MCTFHFNNSTSVCHNVDRITDNKHFDVCRSYALSLSLSLSLSLPLSQLPEMYRMDPPSVEAKPHHKKRKHKHKNLEKGGDSGELPSGGTPSSKFKVPPDAYSFIKQDISSMSPHIAHAPPHSSSHSHSSYMSGGDASVGGMIKQHQPAKDILAAASFVPMVAIPSESSAVMRTTSLGRAACIVLSLYTL